MSELRAHVTVEDTEDQPGLVTCPPSQSQEWAELGTNPALSVVPSGKDTTESGTKVKERQLSVQKTEMTPSMRGVIIEVTSMDSQGGATLRWALMDARRSACL